LDEDGKKGERVCGKEEVFGGDSISVGEGRELCSDGGNDVLIDIRRCVQLMFSF